MEKLKNKYAKIKKNLKEVEIHEKSINMIFVEIQNNCKEVIKEIKNINKKYKKIKVKYENLSNKYYKLIEVIREYNNNDYEEELNTNDSGDYSKKTSKTSNNDNSQAKAKDNDLYLIKDNYDKRIEEQKVFYSCKPHIKQ